MRFVTRPAQCGGSPVLVRSHVAVPRLVSATAISQCNSLSEVTGGAVDFFLGSSPTAPIGCRRAR